MAEVRLEPLRSEDLLPLGRCGWRAIACGDLIALVRAGPSGRAAAIPIGAGKAEALLRFADALVALSRAELIRFLLREAACAALMRLNPLADCARVEWALERSDGVLVPLAPPAEVASIRESWEAYLDPLEPPRLPEFLLASRAAGLQRPDQLQGLLRGEGVEVAPDRELAKAKIRCPGAEPVLESLAELERKAMELLGRHAEAVREMLGKTPALSNLCADQISAQGVLAVCLVGGGFRVACAVAEKLPARDPLEAWGGIEEEEERSAHAPGRAGLRRMPMPRA